MKISKYNFTIEKDDFVLIYNSASGNCLIVSKNEFELFSTLNCNEDKKAQYYKLGFYVPQNTDETQLLINNCKTNLQNRRKKKYRILTTTLCNAKCPYCYEKGIDNITMTEDVAISVADFILSQSSNDKSIEIEWFGGEPLLNTKAIDTITNRILNKKSPEIKFYASIVTNGFLIDNTIAQKMKNNWRIYQAQITLDGLPEEYERVKQLGKHSFEKVIDNINLLSNLDIKVNIRLNFDDKNINKMKELIKYLSTLNFNKNVSVYPAKINDMKQRETFTFENETIEIHKQLHESKFLQKLQLLPRTMKTPCAAVHKGYFTINANGLIYKCERKFNTKSSVGNCKDINSLNLDEIKKWEDNNLPYKCHECKLLPICWGGCIYERINGLDNCGFTVPIVENNLKIILEDYIKDLKNNK